MTNHKEILRLKSLGLSNKEIAATCECGRNTVTRTIQRAQAAPVNWEKLRTLPPEKVTEKLFPERRIPYAGLRTDPQRDAKERRDTESALGRVL